MGRSETQRPLPAPWQHNTRDAVARVGGATITTYACSPTATKAEPTFGTPGPSRLHAPRAAAEPSAAQGLAAASAQHTGRDPIRRSFFEDGIEDEAVLSTHLRAELMSLDLHHDALGGGGAHAGGAAAAAGQQGGPSHQHSSPHIALAPIATSVSRACGAGSSAAAAAAAGFPAQPGPAAAAAVPRLQAGSIDIHSDEFRNFWSRNFSTTSQGGDATPEFLDPDALDHALAHPGGRAFSATLSQFLGDELLVLSSVPELEHGRLRPWSPRGGNRAVGRSPLSRATSNVAALAAVAGATPHTATTAFRLPLPHDAAAEPGTPWSPMAVPALPTGGLQYTLTLPTLPHGLACSAPTPHLPGSQPMSAPPWGAGPVTPSAAPVPQLQNGPQMPAGMPPLPSSPDVTPIQRAYAAAANRFLWRLNVLEGAQVPADPFSNGLVAELSELMCELDQSIATCLVHMGVEEHSICKLLAGDLNALPGTSEVDAMRMILQLKQSFILVFSRAVSAAATASTRSPQAVTASGGRSPLAGSPHSGSGTISAHSHSRGGPSTPSSSATNSGSPLRGGGAGVGARGAAAAAAAAAAAGGADGTGGGGPAPSAAGLTAAAGLAAEMRQKLVDKFTLRLRTNACQVWALLHLLDPKPSRADKEMLMAYTGKTSKQVTDWFTNWRARHWRPGMQILARQMGYGASGEGQGAQE